MKGCRALQFEDVRNDGRVYKEAAVNINLRNNTRGIRTNVIGAVAAVLITLAIPLLSPGKGGAQTPSGNPTGTQPVIKVTVVDTQVLVLTITNPPNAGGKKVEALLKRDGANKSWRVIGGGGEDSQDMTFWRNKVGSLTESQWNKILTDVATANTVPSAAGNLMQIVSIPFSRAGNAANSTSQKPIESMNSGSTPPPVIPERPGSRNRGPEKGPEGFAWSWVIMPSLIAAGIGFFFGNRRQRQYQSVNASRGEEARKENRMEQRLAALLEKNFSDMDKRLKALEDLQKRSGGGGNGGNGGSGSSTPSQREKDLEQLLKAAKNETAAIRKDLENSLNNEKSISQRWDVAKNNWEIAKKRMEDYEKKSEEVIRAAKEEMTRLGKELKESQRERNSAMEDLNELDKARVAAEKARLAAAERLALVEEERKKEQSRADLNETTARENQLEKERRAREDSAMTRLIQAVRYVESQLPAQAKRPEDAAALSFLLEYCLQTLALARRSGGDGATRAEAQITHLRSLNAELARLGCSGTDLITNEIEALINSSRETVSQNTRALPSGDMKPLLGQASTYVQDRLKIGIGTIPL